MTMAARASTRPKMTEHPTLLMSKEMLDEIRAVAEEQRRTVSDIIRRFIENGLRQLREERGDG